MAAIALQNFRVTVVMVAMMLLVLKDMDFFLRTAFGQSTFLMVEQTRIQQRDLREGMMQPLQGSLP